ncbi:hypothetical protein KCU89_g9393, partial [Aureobasidium melanogenum]
MRLFTQLDTLTLLLSSLSSLVAGYNVSTGYISPNSTGVRIQHGFETVLVQPYGYDGFRVRAWAFRPPSGNEISFLYDPPVEDPGNGKAR